MKRPRMGPSPGRGGSGLTSSQGNSPMLTHLKRPIPAPEYAVSVRQPWAELLLRRQKSEEYRPWRLPEKYWNQWLYLHVSASISKKEKLVALMRCGTFDLPRGGYVGKIRFGRPYWGETLCEGQEYVRYPYCWHWPVTGVEWMPFVPAKGKMRIFKVE